MRRRTFLKGSLMGAAATAVPLSALLPGTATAADPVTVTSVPALQSTIDAAAPGDRIAFAAGTYAVPSGGIRVRLTCNDFKLADSAGLDWVTLRGDDVEIDRNHFRHRTTQGVFLLVDGPGHTAVAQRTHIFRNYFADHSSTGANGGEAIRLGVSHRTLSTAGAVVEENLFERCDGDPEAISVTSSGNTVRHSTLRGSKGGIVLRHGNATTAEGNHLLGGANGIRLYGNDHLVVNNHISGTTSRGLVIGSGTTRDHHEGETTEERRGNDACDRAVIVHNTLVASSGSLVSLGTTSGFVWQGNILWGSASDGTIPAGGIHRLTAGSPAVGAGESSALAPVRRPLTTPADDGRRGPERLLNRQRPGRYNPAGGSRVS
ncbi:polysaccharide lyase 6 family protein [Streptomyces sp. CC208A]|uniref:polysaccharide lyase 6 family protein n=1 Tax=Streptomyces sp. CC208A TaxID=3044573 RepID=UPI0024A9ED25|nr:polysaccharide lyase 6 family protein [Streptomyces sp. CC208A]